MFAINLQFWFSVTNPDNDTDSLCVVVIPEMKKAGNTKGGSITVPLTSCLTGLDMSVLQIKTKNFSCHTADSKPIKQEVNGTVILPPLVFPAEGKRESYR
jgi:hypothetical protein